jgi:hypothetical protein
MWGAAPRTGRVSTLLTLLAFLALSVVANAGATIGPSTSSDFNGDGRSDVAGWRPSNGNWYFHNSGSNTFSGIHWGQDGDVPVPGDYDGDNLDEVAVYRDGIWYINNTQATSSTAQFGLPTDLPIPKMYIP